MSEHSSKPHEFLSAHPFVQDSISPHFCAMIGPDNRRCMRPIYDPIHAQAEPNPPHHKWATIRHRSEAEPKPVEVANKWQREDCEKALITLAAAHISTPEETYGTNVSWAVSDLCRAVTGMQQRIASLEAELETCKTMKQKELESI